MKPRTKAAMVKYLAEHFRYHTMNSWNNSTSYAMKVKISHISDGIPNDVVSRMYDCLEVREAFHEPNRILEEFDERYKYVWQIASNGRSSGYLVLIRGGTRPSGYKSYCANCGQRNFKPAVEGDRRCGRCDEGTRVNFKEEDMQVFTQPGMSTDMDEDFASWDISSLKDRVDLVWDFDQTCKASVKAFIEFAKNHKVVDKTILVPKDIRVAVNLKEKE